MNCSMALLTGQEEDFLEAIKDKSGECVSERIMEQTVEFAVFSGEAGSSGPGENDTNSAAATQSSLLVKLSLFGIAMHSASTEYELAVSSCEARSVGPGANGTKSVIATAIANSVEEARSLGMEKYRATSGSKHTEFYGEVHDEVGPTWLRANGTISAAAAAPVKTVGEARPLGFVKYSAATAATAVVPTVVKSVGVGEDLLPGFVKFSATSVSESEVKKVF